MAEADDPRSSEDALRAAFPPDQAPAAHHVPLARGLLREALPDLAKDVTYVTVRKIVLPPGGTTEWHYHPGRLLIVVDQGVLTHTYADLDVETITAGSCFVEARGPEHAHIGTNLGDTPLVMHAVYFQPGPESPLAVQVPAPVDPPRRAP
ncbi:cupin domain-containing protein [Streptomyces alfalfae]|uniref:Cupin domain-containing protein n=1 Tax=Streptomyces alfalfae TaxID=1642299 RepID=A0A7T4U0T7_9ACTN|nr:cupin domain-containing protein [Streptomyces alfalfae]QQC92674.1 cupin domain-containing protein [Streptomyces alfalfae]